MSASQFEVPAGVVTVRLSYDRRRRCRAPRSMRRSRSRLGVELGAADIAGCVGLVARRRAASTRIRRLLATVGNTYVIAEVAPARLDAAVPDLAHFRRLLDATPGLDGRFSLYLYARTGTATLAARMFAPLVGTYEDPATGSAATPLAALLLSLTDGDRAAFEIHQGVKMGRPEPAARLGVARGRRHPRQRRRHVRARVHGEARV